MHIYLTLFLGFLWSFKMIQYTRSQSIFLEFYSSNPILTLRWSWPSDAWRILINPIRSWSPQSRRILDPLNFRNRPSLNKIWIKFELHQKKKLARALKENCSRFRNRLISRLVMQTSRLIPYISWLIKPISLLLYNTPFSVSCLVDCMVD